MPKSRNPGYQGGNNWGICDRCGQAYRQTELVDQHDGLRVCVHDCYDKRHPQEAVRDKGWECGGDGAAGTGLDWNGAGRLARPDVDPLSFIQEPNDAYFTTIPEGTFGQGGYTAYDQIQAIGPWWWIRADLHEDDYADGDLIQSDDYITDFSGNQRDFYTDDSERIKYKKNVTNGLPVFRFAENQTTHTFLRASIGIGEVVEREDLVVWVFFVVDNLIDFPTVGGSDSLGMLFGTQETSGGFQWLAYYNESKSGMGIYSGKRFMLANNSQSLPGNSSIGGAWVDGGGPYLLSGRWHPTLGQSYLRFNGQHAALSNTDQTRPIPTTMPQDLYGFAAGEGQMFGTRSHADIPEGINFRKDLNASEVKIVEDYLAEKYNIPGYVHLPINE